MNIRVDVIASPSATEVSAVSALLNQVARVDHVEAISESGVLALQHHGDIRIQHLLAYSNAELVGYAVFDGRDSGKPVGEIAVAPDFRRHGVGSVLLREIEARAGSSLSIWAHGNIGAAQEFAAHHSYSPGRVLEQLGRSLTSALPAAQFASDVQVRPFAVGQDEQAWLRLNAEAFAAHPEQGRWTSEDLADRQQQDWFDPAGFLLAEQAKTGELVGSVWTKVDAVAGAPSIGEIYVVAIRPTQQRRGLGAALTLAGLAHLQECGLSKAMLFVDESNIGATRLYQRLGFTCIRVDVQYRR